MAKLIPFSIKKNNGGTFEVIEAHTGEIVDVFVSRSQAAEFVKTARQNEDGEWDIDFESIWLNGLGDPDAALTRAENIYERQFCPTSQDVGL